MNYLKITYMALSVAVLCGCETTVTYTTDPNQTTYSREDVLKMPDIQLPANYNTDDFKTLKMGVAVAKLEGREIDRNGKIKELSVDPDLSARLQGQFASLKRFTVYSVFNRDGVQFFKEVSDVGDVSISESKTPISPDYILSLNIRITKERHVAGRTDESGAVHFHGEKVFVVAECDGNCMDVQTHTCYFSEKSRGRQWYAKNAGFDASEKAKLAGAIDAAAKKAILEMMNKVGNYFPVGGKVTDVTPSGKQMAMDKGEDQGVAESQQCVIFVRDNGVDIPLALAEAESGKDECTLDVYKWNDEDPDAAYFIEKYKAGPTTFAEENAIFAVGYGLPPSKKMEL